MNPPLAHKLAHEVTNRITELVSESCPDHPQPGLLVALSGGPDSVALLLGAHLWADRTGSSLAAAHLHHGLRGADADADAEFCRRLCADRGIEFFTDRADLRPVARSRGLGQEEAGRHLRRRFFRQLLTEHDHLQCVATGHHLDDQAETVIMRLFRGTGFDGLAGIAAVQSPFIRPLLDISRRQLVAWLESVGQPWRIDASNLDGDNLRARLRRELLPVVREIFGPGSAQLPARFAELAAPDIALLQRLTDAAAAELIHQEAGEPQLDIPGLLALDAAMARRLLRRFLAAGPDETPGTAAGAEPQPTRDLRRVHIDSILTWLAGGTSGTSLDLPGGRQLRREFDRLLLGRGSSAGVPLRSASDYRIVVQGATVGEDPAYLNDDASGLVATGDGPWRLTVPAACLSGNLSVRNWRRGDRFQPLGAGGTKKLSDLLRERRVPAPDRPNILVVADEQGILWVIGLARDERTRVLPGTDKAVTIYLAARSGAFGGMSRNNGNQLQGNESE